MFDHLYYDGNIIIIAVSYSILPGGQIFLTSSSNLEFDETYFLLMDTKLSISTLIVENVLNREFSVKTPSKVWVSDITYIKTKEGFKAEEGASKAPEVKF